MIFLIIEKKRKRTQRSFVLSFGKALVSPESRLKQKQPASSNGRIHGMLLTSIV